MNKQREILILAIGVFMTVVAWVSIEIFRVRNVSTLEKVITLPTVKRYTVDTKVFDTLKQRNP